MHFSPSVTPILVSFGSAAAAALAFTPLARSLARRWGVVDAPDGGRKLQKRPVALLGGAALFLALATATTILSSGGWLDTFAARLPWIFAGLLTICVVGVCDDIVGLSPRWKLLGQVCATFPILKAGCVMTSISLCGTTIPLGYLSVPISIAWLVAGTNALNLIDGMDGLASTTGLMISLGVASVGALVGDPATAFVALALAGAAAGFLAYNLPPATIYLGDAGSMVIGLAISLLTLLVACDAEGASHITVMVALLAVPVGDTTLAIIRRRMSGYGIWQADRGHFHHRLLDQGYRPRGVLGVVVGLCLITGSLAAISRVIGWEPLAWSASLLVAAGLVKAKLVGYHEWALTKKIVAYRYRTAGVAAPTEQELIPLAFEDAWGRLVDLCEKLSVARLQLTIWEKDDAGRRLYWSAEDASSSGLVAMEFSSSTSEGGSCVLRAESAPSTENSTDWPRLARILWRFSQHWAAHCENLPLDAPLVALEGARTIPLRPAANARRAA